MHLTSDPSQTNRWVTAGCYVYGLVQSGKRGPWAEFQKLRIEFYVLYYLNWSIHICKYFE